MSTELKSTVEFLDHTGDIRMRVQCPTLPELFISCARGMIACVAPDAVVASQVRRTVTIDADDLEQLLVHWLSEINFNIIVQNEIYSAFELPEFSSTHLSATLTGEKIDPVRHPFALEIKAVTYHHLYVHSIPGGWQAQVIFDI